MGISSTDHIAIERLMYRYAQCADRKDYEGFADVFCDDAVFDYAGKVVTPRSAIQEMMRALEKYTRTMHQVHNVLYAVEGDMAKGETYCLASHLLDDTAGEIKIDMGVIYKDSLRRTDQGWRIAHRRFNLLWSQTAPVDVR